MALQQDMFALVEQQAQQSITIAEFCDRHAISYGKFHYWRRQWKDAHQPEEEIAGQGFKSGFIEIQPTPPGSELSVRLIDGSELLGSPQQLALFFHHLQLLDRA